MKHRTPTDHSMRGNASGGARLQDDSLGLAGGEKCCRT